MTNFTSKTTTAARLLLHKIHPHKSHQARYNVRAESALQRLNFVSFRTVQQRHESTRHKTAVQCNLQRPA